MTQVGVKAYNRWGNEGLLIRIKEKNKIALVLSGGGVKAAAFHVGVCLALKEKGFLFQGGFQEGESVVRGAAKSIKMYVGSSAGAFVAALLAAGYSPESLIDAFDMRDHLRSPDSIPEGPRLPRIQYTDLFALNTSSLWRMVPSIFKGKSLVTGGIEVLIKSGFKVNGLFSTRGIENYLRNKALKTNRFSELATELFVVATQLNHSRKVVFGPFPESSKRRDIKFANYASISDAVAASASLPPVFAPYGIRNQKGKEIFYFDGEIRDTLSTHVASDHGADLVISSYSIQPYHFNKTMGSLHNYGIPLIMNQALYQVIEQKIQKHIAHKGDIRALLSAVDGYFKQSGLPEEHRIRLLSVLTERVGYKPNVDYLYIHPLSQDYEMFFADHFSLTPEILADIARIGFRAALRVLRKNDL